MMDSTIQSFTFLFTDIEGSTRLWETSAEIMRHVLVRHDALAQELISSHGGRIVKSRGEGDSLFAVFETAANGVMAACALQQALHSEAWAGGWTVRVRMALHQGAVEIRDDDFYGPTINRCARLRAIAHGGQVLISQAVFDAAELVLQDPLTLKDMGRHRLKDLQQPERVYQVNARDLAHDFPPLLSLNYIQHNLPIQTTSFVGREREIEEIRKRLDDTAELTLQGAGGSGKSRLALQAAADRIDRAVDGVWIIDLAAISDPEMVVQAVSAVLGLREEPGEPLIETLCAYLKPRTTLLLLDSCEHLVAACAELAEAVLRACPNARILATSRERLGIAGEHVFPVPTLELPPANYGAQSTGAAQADPSKLFEYASVRLFCERAFLQQPSFALTGANAGAVAEICRTLDGIPLALELAAARVRSLSPDQILARLGDRFRLLTGGSRTAVPRQQTLEALIDWSYDLLSAQEKSLLHGLTVFAGGWTLDAAEAIFDREFWTSEFAREAPQDAGEVASRSKSAGRRPSGRTPDVLDLLTSLVDKSLVVFSTEGGGRYRLLETIRQYASIRAEEAGSVELTAGKHSAWFLKFAQEVDPHLRGSNQADWLERLEIEHDNVRAALANCLPDRAASSDSRPDEGLALCGALWWFWHVRGYLREGRSWLERALAFSAAPSEARAEALTGLGMLALQGNDLQTTERAYTEALDIRRTTSNSRGIAVSLTNLGNVALDNGQLDRARSLYQECTALWESLGEEDDLARAWNNLGAVAKMQGDLHEARNLFQRGLNSLRVGGDARSIALLLYNLAEVETEEKDYAAAEADLVECLSILEAVEDKYVHAYAVHMLGSLAYATGREHAALRLWSASQVAFEKIGTALKPDDDQVLQSAKQSIREQIGDLRYAELWQSGRSTPLSAASSILQDATVPNQGK